MSNNESIKDTLDVIRRALEDKEDFTEKNENILILNKKVNDDGTVKLLNQSDQASIDLLIACLEDIDKYDWSFSQQF